jgi:hypothetical protein
MRMKLDPTLKRLGNVLRQRTADIPAEGTPRRIALLLERLSRCESQPLANDPYAGSGAK